MSVAGLTGPQRRLLEADGSLEEVAEQVGYSVSWVRWQRAKMLKRFGVKRYDQAVRRYQVAVDETAARLERLEGELQRTNEALRKANENGSRHDQAQATRAVARIEDDFTEEERRMVREHREWSAFERNMTRWEEQKARVAAAALPTDDDTPDDDTSAKPKTKAKPKKPASRHADDDTSDDDAATTPPVEPPKSEPWWKRD